MDNTIYSAASGMLARQKSMNTISNNLSNMETNGFKRSETVLESFGEYITSNTDDNKVIGTKTHGVVAGELYTDFGQGTITPTGRDLDFAIDGFGFFTLNSEEGDTFLTRDGHFNIDDNGFLIDKTGNFVMGQNGRINFLNGDLVAESFLITVPENVEGMEMLSNGLITAPEAATTEFTGRIINGAIEKSNVNITDEMAAMIEDSRAFQSCSQMLRIADSIMQKTVNEIGSI